MKHIFIKLANKNESNGGTEMQKTLIKLKDEYKKEVVYMPYGNCGRGFYVIN